MQPTQPYPTDARQCARIYWPGTLDKPCTEVIPAGTRPDKRYCSRVCKVAARDQRKKRDPIQKGLDR